MSPFNVFILAVLLVNSVYCQDQGIGKINTNPDGTYNLAAQVPLAGDDKNRLSAIGSVSGLKPSGSLADRLNPFSGSFQAIGGGLALDNVNGHQLSFTGEHIPNIADKLSVNARLNILSTPNHNLDANAFMTKVMPKAMYPDYTQHGGSLNYMFKDKIGASLGATHTPQWQKTDVSAMGTLNLFKDRTTSLDLFGGASKSYSPHMPRSSWEPMGGATLTKYW